jgi:hypothetical protein
VHALRDMSSSLYYIWVHGSRVEDVPAKERCAAHTHRVGMPRLGLAHKPLAHEPPAQGNETESSYQFAPYDHTSQGMIPE